MKTRPDPAGLSSRTRVVSAALILVASAVAVPVASSTMAETGRTIAREIAPILDADDPARIVETGIPYRPASVAPPDEDQLWHEDGELVLAKPPMWQCDGEERVRAQDSLIWPPPDDLTDPEAWQDHLEGATGNVTPGPADLDLSISTPFPILPVDDDPEHRGVARIDGEHWIIPELEGSMRSEVDSIWVSFHRVQSGTDLLGSSGDLTPDAVCDEYGVTGDAEAQGWFQRRGDTDGSDGWIIQFDTQWMPNGLYVVTLEAHAGNLLLAEASAPEATAFTYALVDTAEGDVCGSADLPWCGADRAMPPRWPSIVPGDVSPERRPNSVSFGDDIHGSRGFRVLVGPDTTLDSGWRLTSVWVDHGTTRLANANGCGCDTETVADPGRLRITNNVDEGLKWPNHWVYSGDSIDVTMKLETWDGDIRYMHRSVVVP